MIKGFTDIVITDITVGQINHYFAEIVPRTVYPLYGTFTATTRNACIHEARDITQLMYHM